MLVKVNAHPESRAEVFLFSYWRSEFTVHAG